MEIRIEIVSKEFIKPSSPTPHHPKTFNISLFDQLSVSNYVPMLLFYPSNSRYDIANRSHILKKSLSKTLALYYPLAGRKRDSISIDCTDDGAKYICATTDSYLSDYLKTPSCSSFPKFMPEESVYGDLQPGEHLVMIQETRFSCGGMAIGVAISHFVCDAPSISCFIKSWSAIARHHDEDANQDLLSPAEDFTLSTRFPSADFHFEGFASTLNIKMSNIPHVAKRFVFDGTKVANLKLNLKSSTVPNPTRVEVVSAVLFRSIRKAIETKSTKQNSSVLAMTQVGLRKRMVPPLRESCLGNLVWTAPFLLDNDRTDLREFISRMRKAVSTIDEDFVKSFEVEGGFERPLRELKRSCAVSSTHTIPITSWCNSGLYESDFGWGKPLWIPCVGASRPFPYYYVKLMDTRNGVDIDAWVTLDEETMSLVENDAELLSLAALEPSLCDLVTK